MKKSDLNSLWISGNRRKTILILVLLVILLSLPLCIYLVSTTQIVRSDAVSKNINPSFQTIRTSAVTENVSLSIQPSSQTVKLGESVSVQVYIDPNTIPVSGVELFITYDASKINISSIQPGSIFTYPQSQIGAPVEIMKDTVTPGKIHYAIGFPLGSKYTSTAAGSVAIITFSGISPGTTNLTIDQKSLVSDAQSNNVLGTLNGGVVIVSALPTPTYFPPITYSPTISLFPTEKPLPTVTYIPPVTSTPKPPAEPTVTPQYPEEELIVEQASLLRSAAKNKSLEVIVYSNLSPYVSLTVEGFGDLRYNRKNNYYSGKFHTTQSPEYITITSSEGTEVEITVNWE